jgi:hypothetical protein
VQPAAAAAAEGSLHASHASRKERIAIQRENRLVSCA